MGGTAGEGGTMDAGGSGGAAGEGGTFEGDPCVANIAFDCAGDCGGTSDNCSVLSCKPGYDTYEVVSADDFPLTIRTPDRPGIDPNCVSLCGDGNVVYGLSVSINVPFQLADGSLTTALRVNVGEPWVIADSTRPEYCIGAYTGPLEGCYARSGSFIHIQILTRDPLAPARNATFELLPEYTPCQ